jgi:hypothetical protein
MNSFNGNGTNNLKQVHYGENFNALSSYCFYYWKAVGTIVIPNTVKYAGTCAATALKVEMQSNLLILANSSENQNNSPFITVNSIFKRTTLFTGDALDTYYIKDGLAYAKSGNTWECMGVVGDMQSVQIEDGCKSISNWFGSSVMQVAPLPSTIVRVESKAFHATRIVGMLDLSNCQITGTLDIYPVVGSNLSGCKVPYGITYLGNEFLRFSKVSTFDIPSSVTGIGARFLSHLNNISSLAITCHWQTPISLNSSTSGWFYYDYNGNHYHVTVHIPVGTTQAYIDKGWNQSYITLVDDVND